MQNLLLSMPIKPNVLSHRHNSETHSDIVMDLSLYHLDSTFFPSTLLDMHGDALLPSTFFSSPFLHHQQQYKVPLLSSTNCLSDLATSPPGLTASLFGRVFSTGDLKEQSNKSESVVVRYSPEERRERIDKYRSKRNHRNFHKKITYACRKTMADSRLRVKGRFARNPDSSDQPNAAGQIDNNNNGGVIGVGVGKAQVPEWWPGMQEALERDKDDEALSRLLLHCNDHELVAAYLGVSPINLYSSPFS